MPPALPGPLGRRAGGRDAAGGEERPGRGDLRGEVVLTGVAEQALPLEELGAAVDGRTLELLQQRRETGSVKRRGWLVRRALAAADIGGLGLAFLLAQWLLGGGARLSGADESFLFLATLPAWVVVAKLYGLYDRDEERTDHSTADDVVGVFHVVTVGSWLFFAGSWLTGLADPQIEKVIAFWILAMALVSSGRALMRAHCRRHIAYLQNTIIVGAGDVGQLIARKLLRHPEYGLNLVGFVDDPRLQGPDRFGRRALLGEPADLPSLIRLLDVERVIVAFSNDGHEDVLGLVRALRELDVQIDVVPRLFEIVGPGVSVHTIEGVPLLGLPPVRLARSSAFLKRSADLVLGGIGLVLVAPLLALVALAIKLDSAGPVFFRQVRMGSGDRTFRIWKFRTMVEDAEALKAELRPLNRHGASGKMFKVADDPRVTRVGRWLRHSSLDELPQLLNVLRGEMSLVGPRPLVLDEDREVRAWGRRRLDLKPGMTGLWQVLGSSAISFEEMVKLDYLYVTTWSLGGDLRLLFRTIPLVARGANAD